jgi:hypothetical protein
VTTKLRGANAGVAVVPLVGVVDVFTEVFGVGVAAFVVLAVFVGDAAPVLAVCPLLAGGVFAATFAEVGFPLARAALALAVCPLLAGGVFGDAFTEAAFPLARAALVLAVFAAAVLGFLGVGCFLLDAFWVVGSLVAGFFLLPGFFAAVLAFCFLVAGVVGLGASLAGGCADPAAVTASTARTVHMILFISIYLSPSTSGALPVRRRDLPVLRAGARTRGKQSDKELPVWSAQDTFFCPARVDRRAERRAALVPARQSAKGRRGRSAQDNLVSDHHGFWGGLGATGQE